MTLPTHAYKSWMFVPGDDSKKLCKALASEADVVIFDLEDAVTLDRKAVARSLTSATLRKPARPARYVRVNDLTTGRTAEDVAETIRGGPDGYVLPKCEGPQDIEALATMIRSHEPEHLPGILAICTETVRAVRNLMRLDWAHPMLVGLTWGGEDLQADLGARSNRTEDGRYLSAFAMARDLALFAARDADVLAIDAVYTDFRNEPGLVEEARLAKRLGFDGKMAIHPAQVDHIQTNFAPGQAEKDWAAKVIQLLEANKSGVAQLDGQMLDQPHLKLAKKILGAA